MEGLFSDPFKNGAYWKGVGGSFSIYTYICILYIMFYWKKHFSTYLFRFLVYRLNLLLFRVTLSVHSKACKVHLKITTVRCYCSII